MKISKSIVGLVVAAAVLACPGLLTADMAAADAAPAPATAPAQAQAQAAAPAPTGTAAKGSVAGDWSGAVDVGGTKLRLVIHVSPAENGTLKATFDSPDQGAMGIPFDKAAYENGTLRLEIAAIRAHYEGKLGADGKTMDGTWTQNGGSVPLPLERAPATEGGGSAAAAPSKDSASAEAPPAKPVASDPIRELWLGTIDAGGTKIRLAIHLSRGPDGVLAATFDSPDQGAMGIPVDAAVYKGGKLTLEVKRIMARYEGTMGKDGTAIDGHWTQGGVSLPLVLSPIDTIPEPNRPQEPKRPLSYLEEEVGYTNASAGVKLAGTLTMPKTGGPFPAVVLITGSGAEDRNETVFGHRPFLVLSDDLTRRGIAVLRVDDRGVGGSSPGSDDATTEDFVGDVLAGVAYLKGRKEIDPARIGLVGHSEGGLIAPRAAIRSKDVAFVVMMAGPGLPGEAILAAQNALIMKAGGASTEEIDHARALNTHIYTILREEKDATVGEKKMREVLASIPELSPQAVEMRLKTYRSAWFRHFLTYDPRPTLAQVKVPVLAMNGERDLQVPAQENTAAIRAALDGAGHKDHTVVILPGLNHLFQTCTTGAPSEYAGIEETLSPSALKTISDWILARTTRKS